MTLCQVFSDHEALQVFYKALGSHAVNLNVQGEDKNL